MPTIDQPLEVNQRDSALVEKRGPSMTTSAAVDGIPAVGLSLRTGQSPADGAVRIGERDVDRAVRVVIGLHPARCAIDELVRDHKGARAVPHLERPDGARCQHLAHAEGAKRPEVRPIGNAMGRKPVVAAVAGHERH